MTYEEAVAAAPLERPRALQHRRRRVRQAPSRQAGDGVGGLPRRAARGRLGRAAGRSPTGGQRAARAWRRARRPGRDAAARRRPRRRRSSSARGRPGRSCSRCPCSTATRASATAIGLAGRRRWCTDADQRRPDRPGPRRGRDGPRRRAARRRLDDDFDTVDTAADDPAQLYYSSGTTGLAKGILHAHRYLLAHEEFVYCHDVREGELFHGMGEWAWAAGIAPLLGPWRLGATQFVFQRQGGFDPEQQLDVLSRHGVDERVHHPDGDAGDDGHRGRRHALSRSSSASSARPASRSTRRRSAGSASSTASRCSTSTGSRSPIRCARTSPSWRCARARWAARCRAGTCRSSTRTSSPWRRASGARSACARGRTRTTRSATGTSPEDDRGDLRRRVVPHQGRRRAGRGRLLLVRRARRRRDHLGGLPDRPVRGRVGLHRAPGGARGRRGRVARREARPRRQGLRRPRRGPRALRRAGRRDQALRARPPLAYAYPRRIEFVDDLPKTLTGKIRRIELRERESPR